MAIGFLVSYPYRAVWYIGLLCHIFGAGMIGGLADWYAVTALFGKPLGISWKTNLLAHRHDDLIKEAHKMVMEELLTKRHIYKVLKGETLVDSMAAYILSDIGRTQMHSIFTTIVLPMRQHMDMNLILDEVKLLATRSASAWRLSPLVISLLEQLLRPEPLTLLWRNIISMGKDFISSKAIRPYLLTLVESILAHYSSGGFMRKQALKLVEDRLSPERIVDLIQKHAVSYLETQEPIDSPLAKRVITKAHLLVDELTYNASWQEKIEAYKLQYLEALLDTNDIFALNMNDEETFNKCVAAIEEYILCFVSNIYTDDEKKRPINRLFLYVLDMVIKKVYPYVDQFVRKQLESYSAEVMSVGIKNSVAHDLQLVRVNGSLVGAVLGGLFYAISLAVKAVMV